MFGGIGERRITRRRAFRLEKERMHFPLPWACLPVLLVLNRLPLVYLLSTFIQNCNTFLTFLFWFAILASTSVTDWIRLGIFPAFLSETSSAVVVVTPVIA